MQSISNMFVMLVMVCGVSHIFAHPLSGSMTQNESESSTAIVSDTTTQSALDESSTSTTQTVLDVSTQTESEISTQTEIGEPSTTESAIDVTTQSPSGQREILASFSSSEQVLSQVSDESEDMEVAETIIFRPLFSYRRDSASRGRF